MPSKRICLISPGHIAASPRLLKEANSLHAAGFQVQVVVGDYMAEMRPLDQAILQNAPWKWAKVGVGATVEHVGRQLIQGLAGRITKKGGDAHLAIATWAHNAISDRLATVAVAKPADLYIAHDLAALPAAAKAARRHHTRFGFDAETFHTGELVDTPEHEAEIAIRDHIERTLLPQCHYLAAASPLIADAYRERYGVTMQPILNVFPRSETPLTPERPSWASSWEQFNHRIGTEPSLYWCSQTIEPGQGLETILRAMGKMKIRTRLHVRGIPASGYEWALTQFAWNVGVGDHLHFLPPVSPNEMVRAAAYHDVGLAFEQNEPLSRSMGLTSRIFAYLAAGLPVVMSKTLAQDKLSYYLGEAAILIGDDPLAIAAILDRWLADPVKVDQRRQTAWSLAQSIYNWDVEKKLFLEGVEQALR